MSRALVSALGSPARPAPPILALAAAILLLAAAPALARPGAVIHLSNGSLPLAQLPVGEELYVSLSGAPASSPLEVRLYDQDGAQIRAEVVYTDAAGNSPPLWLWVETGVVGCDSCLAADPSAWLYATYADAETALVGQVLLVEVRTYPGGTVLASQTLPVIARPDELAYFSDAAGCPRQLFGQNEPIFLTFRRPDPSLPQRRLFLPAAAPSWPLGQPIVDARGALQVMSLPPASPGAILGQITFAVAGTASLAGGEYDGLTRQLSIDIPIRLGGDVVITGRSACGDGRIRGGIVITLEDCTNCPPSSP